MFKTARMRKIKIVIHDKYLSPTVNALHEQGLIQINDISDRVQQDPELAELVTPSKATPQTGKLSSLLMKTTGISELLGNSLSEGHGLKDKIKSLVSPELPVPKEIEDLDTDAFIVKAEETLEKVEAKTSVIEGKLSSLEAEKSELRSNKSLAEKLNNFDMDLALLKDSKYTSTTVGRIDVESASEIKSDLSKLTDELDVFIVPTDDKESSIIVVVTLKEYNDDVFAELRKYNFEKIEIGDVEGNPQQIISKADSRLQSIESEYNSVKAELRAIAEQWDDEILALKEQLEIEKEKNEIFSAFVQTRDTHMLEAWVPLKDVETVEQLVETTSEGHCAFEVIDIEGTDDLEVPVLQDNPRYSKPYEFIVGMYNPVRYNSVDPTVLVSIVFPFFFGFCLTDAFYGIFISLIGVILIRGLGKTRKSLNSMGYILIMCGIWTIILGLATNGFIGDFTERFLNYRIPFVIDAIESFVHPENILIMALTVGIIYENIGFLIGAINNIRYGEVKEALGSQICWFFLEAGVVCLAAGFLIPSIGMIGMGIGAVLIIICFVMLIYNGGFYGIMDVFSYIGNILSYARLLALCLATGGIAMTVNILTGMCMDMIPYIGIILAVIVFIFGHIANFMVNFLGSFINSMRLHYVEFFSQFFMDGKNSFEAFKANRLFTKLKN